MKTKLLLALAAMTSTSAMAIDPAFYSTPYDCVSNTTYEILFSGGAFNYQIPALVAQCEAQGGTLIYFHLNDDF